MSWSPRRAIVVLIAILAGGAATLLQTALADQILLKQVAQPAIEPVPEAPLAPGEGPTDPGDFFGFTLLKDNQMKRRVEAAEDYIRVEDWVRAAEILQRLIEHPSDVMAQLPRKGPDGKPALDKEGSPVLAWTSVKKKAHELLASLPREGMEYYKVTYGPSADELLKKAREQGNVEMLGEVASRFLFTDAGGEAIRLLATYHLDRGNYVMANLCFERLLERDGITKVAKTDLFKAAYAFHQTGNAVREAQVWTEINNRGGEVQLGEESLTVADLKAYLAGLTRQGQDLIRLSWPLFGGSASRTAKGDGDTAFMERRWSYPLATTSETKQWLANAFSFLQQRGHPQIPAFFPISATVMKNGEKLPLLIFRSHYGIHAIHMKTGDRVWECPSEWSLDRMVRSAKKIQAITSWVGYYQSQKPSILFENSAVGSLSTDNTLVYAVEDLQVPPPPHFQAGVRGRAPRPDLNDVVNDATEFNQLRAFDLVTGKLRWQIGEHSDKGELSDSYFLGPPLPLAGKLYVLNEKLQDLRLVTLEPSTGKLLNLQVLGTTKDKIQQDITRRTHAAHLAYGEGMLICPTNSGALLCIDLLTNSLVWAYPYREGPDEPETVQPGGVRRGIPPGMVRGPDGRPYKPGSYDEWKVSAPIIHEGKVVFTAPDADAVHCVSLRDQTRIWSQKRGEDDLYLAGVYNGKVLIVGKRACTALSLTTGQKLWSVETGLPSGYGVASGNIYYLPVKEGIKSKEPEICAIDLERGIVHAHTKSRKNIVPGNLLFYEGDVLSQSATEVIAFPQLKVKLAQIDKLISANPDDPIGLTERGELRLDKGDLQGAVADLRKALGQESIPDEVRGKARTKLYESLTELFQRDFDTAEKYTEEYEGLCRLDLSQARSPEDRARLEKETQRRLTSYLCLVAKGKEKQRKLVEAFEKYQEFTALAGDAELISVVDEPTVKAAPDVWAQGRIAAMVASASPQERRPLEERIAQRWADLKNTDDLAQLKKFVALFGSLFTVGKEARLQLADRLMQASDPEALLDAERHLQLLRLQQDDRVLRGRATEALARLYTRKGLLQDAAYYYSLLGSELADVVVIDGKTGADLFNELATDKRFLGYLDRPGRLRTSSRIKVTEERSSFPYRYQTYTFGIDGEELPYFQESRLALRFDNHHLQLIDQASGKERWSKGITRTMFQNLVYGNGQPDRPRFTFQTLGHLMVLPLGHMVFGIDPIRGEILWEKNLYSPGLISGEQAGSASPTRYNQLLVDPRDGSIQVIYPDGWMQRLGTTGSLAGGVVCLQTREGLLAIDPVNGNTLWTRTDISSRSVLFNDGENIYVVEMSGANGNVPAGTRALRAYDGVSVKINDFTSLYENRLRLVGRRLLLKETVANKGEVVRLYDVLTGKDIWSQTYPAGSLVLNVEQDRLLGIAEPSGKLHVVDLHREAEVLTAALKPEHIKGVETIHLLSDGKDYFVLCNGPANPNVAVFGRGVRSSLLAGTGMRSLPVNGMVYAFDGATGKLLWYLQVENQMVVLEHFRELPFLLFASQYQMFQNVGVNRRVVQVTAVKSIHKGNGKRLYDNNSDPAMRRGKLQPLPNGVTFYALNIDPLGGTIDLVGHSVKITHHLTEETASR